MASQSTPQSPEQYDSVVDRALREYEKRPYSYRGRRPHEIAMQLTHEFLQAHESEPMQYIASRIIDGLEANTNPRDRHPHPRWYQEERNMLANGTFQPGYEANFQGAEDQLARMARPRQVYGAAPIPNVGQPPAGYAGGAANYSARFAGTGAAQAAPPNFGTALPPQAWPAPLGGTEEFYTMADGRMPPPPAPGYNRGPPPVYAEAEQRPPDLRQQPPQNAGPSSQQAPTGARKKDAPRPIVRWDPPCDACAQGNKNCGARGGASSCGQCKYEKVPCLIHGISIPARLKELERTPAERPCRACYVRNRPCVKINRPRVTKCASCVGTSRSCDRRYNDFEARYYNPGHMLEMHPRCSPCRDAGRVCTMARLADQGCQQCPDSRLCTWPGNV